MVISFYTVLYNLQLFLPNSSILTRILALLLQDEPRSLYLEFK